MPDSHAMADAINYTIQQPMGVCGLITPWNLPLYLLSWKVRPSLTALPHAQTQPGRHR